MILRHGQRVGFLICCVVGAACTGTKPSASVRQPAIGYVFISVTSDSVQSRVQVIDAHERKTGWVKDEPVNQIPGCAYSSSTGEETLDDDDPSDSDSARAVDSLLAQSWGPPPTGHMFQITKPSTPPFGAGVLAEGTCELWVEPLRTGTIGILATATRGSSPPCAKTRVEAAVTPGTRYGWRVQWKPVADSCVIQLKRIAQTRTGKL